MIMRPLIVALASLVAGAAHAQPAPSVLDCTGVFARESSHATLVRVFGAPNVAFRTIPGPEGSKLKATVVFGNDKRRRLEFLWHDERARRRPSMITVDRGSGWRTPHGVGIGLGLAEVERLNGKPFELAGFDWDYGGTVYDWKAGMLARLPGGCRLIVRFEPGPNPPPKAANAVSGDREFSSADPNMRAVKPTAYQIGLSYEK